MKVKVICPDGQIGYLTTEHAASSYGLPVLLLDGENDTTYGPGDLGAGPLVVTRATDEELSRINAAGWLIDDLRHLNIGS